MGKSSESKRDEGVHREHAVSSLIHRVSPGKCLALVFMFRAMTWATGCSSGPADGTLGGKCKNDGCELTCTDGSVCDQSEDVCVSSSDTSGGGSGSVPPVFGPLTPDGCTEGDYGDCNSDEVQLNCTVGYAPSAEYSCQPPENQTYCCVLACNDCDAGADGDAAENESDASDAEAGYVDADN